MSDHLEQSEILALFASGQKFEPTKFATVSNVVYDERLERGDYFMVRGQYTDGTHALAYMMIADMIGELARCESYHKSNPPDWERLQLIKYTVGKVSLTEGRDATRTDFRTWHERFVMPVKCEYVY